MKEQQAIVGHVVRRALRSLRENLYLNFVAAGVIGAALLLIGVYLTVQHNLNRIVDTWDRDVHVSAYFHPGVPEDRRFAIRDSLSAQEGVQGVRYVSESDAKAWMVDRMEGISTALDELGPEALPASLEITLADSITSAPGGIATFAESLPATDFSDIDYGQEWVERFNAFLQLLTLLGALLGSLILVAAVFLAVNTVNLIVYNRRAEVEIQNLVGATSSFIIAPFALEGLIHGTFGALLSCVGLYGVHHLVVRRLQQALDLGLAGDLAFLEAPTLVGLVFAGALLGIGASSYAVYRFLRRAA